MANYSRYKTEMLLRMKSRAESKYFEETMKHKGNWGDGMRLSKLPSLSAWTKAKERLEAIKAELASRK